MKSKNLLVLVLSLSFASAFAQSGEQYLNSAPINVDGYLAEDKPVTDGELEQIRSEIRKQKNEVQLNKDKTKGFKELIKTTEKLSDTTEEYIDEKKSAQKEIADYNAKIKCLMEENPGKDCDKYIRNRNRNDEVVQEVAVAQAAPAAMPVSVADVAATSNVDKAFEEIKLLPYVGGTQFNGEREQLEAELAGGLRLESNINSRFSMGIGFNYTSLKTQDFANGFMNNTFGGVYNSPAYYNAYGQQGREIQYQGYGLDLYGKFFLTRGERFRPYVGVGLGYSAATMRYSQNEQYNNGYSMFGNENYKTNFARGTIMAGSEVMITRGFGLNIEAAYSTGLGGGAKNNANSYMRTPDEYRLRELGKDIINANALSIFAGAVIIF